MESARDFATPVDPTHQPNLLLFRDIPLLYSYFMDPVQDIKSRHRLQLSTLLLLIIGLCSIGSPDSLKSAHLHHRSPASSSRTTRQLSRSRLGSSRTSTDAEVEPEVSNALVVAGADTHPRFTSTAVLPSPLHFTRAVCVSCTVQDDPSAIASSKPLPRPGRAPPVA